MRDNEYFAKKLMIEMKKYAFKPDRVKHSLLVDILEDAFENEEDFAVHIIMSVQDLKIESKAVLLSYLGFCPRCLRCDKAKSLSFECIAQIMEYESWQEARAVYKEALEEIARDFINYYFVYFAYRDDE